MLPCEPPPFYVNGGEEVSSPPKKRGCRLPGYWQYHPQYNAEIGKNVLVGPFARLRNGAVIQDNVKIGNFVEVKKSVVGEDSKASHLAYIGDAEIGKGCNIGCGAIFVNYDGKDKHKSTVGDNCFIGSNCNVIAPCDIEDDSYICAGTTVTKKVEKGDFVIGRVRQEHKKNYKHKYLKKD